MAKTGGPLVGIVMGSKSEWETMRHAGEMLERFGVAYERVVMRATRMRTKGRKSSADLIPPGVEVIIASASGNAGLPGALAGLAHVPVLGVPVASSAREGLERLAALARLPAGIPVGSLAIGDAGAKNAALLAVQILALSDKPLRMKLKKFRQDQTKQVMETTL